MISIVHDKILDYTGSGSVPCVVVGQKSDLSASRYVTNYPICPFDSTSIFRSTRGMLAFYLYSSWDRVLTIFLFPQIFAHTVTPMLDR